MKVTNIFVYFSYQNIGL